MVYAFVSYYYIPGFNTPESWVKTTAIYDGFLKQLSMDNTVNCINQIDYTGRYTRNGINYHFVDFHKKKTHFPYKINAYIKKLNPDVVVVHGMHNPLEVMQLRLILKAQTRIIIQHHAEQPFKGVKKYVQRTASRFADAYLFASKPMGINWYHKGNLASANKVYEVMEVSSVFGPVNRAAALSKTGATGQPVFLWVGRLNANKDPLTVVKSFLKYLELRPQAKLYMIYHTEELLPDMRHTLSANPCYQNNVVLIGKVPHHELLYWYNSADIFISASHYEGSGTALVEAMSCGCVPLVTDIDAFRMITDNGSCGFLYEAGNEEMLLQTLQQIHKTDLQAKRKQSMDYYNTTLSFKAIAGRFKAIAVGLFT